MSAEEDAEKWKIISEHWIDYCKLGANTFDWDYDSRSVMKKLTGEHPFQWMKRTDIINHDVI